ncbi:hypothetical protein N5D45_11295 [Stenotrophomonas sp. GD03819]|uniref:hypothetical protein n=1 Tax=Stenotrophomonas TaxID=40323 RepID=UPI0013DD6463|nr:MULTISPECIES: hypothetical protein [Stenotrophomonas]ELN2586591.1 hypothetical protein [Stenotrophomonas maltophilia]ELN2594556.1 hypothetical protein [Stenotrophomonas maltophilia]MBH1401362.1 hypothetical protein [Stenotrophomonas maltophilia]MDH1792404.1 hypothetical protein [Stenotrophomonas sp. GD03819]MDT3474754.1 hypothetical protein [Stenotrophomonas maltophilia]
MADRGQFLVVPAEWVGGDAFTDPAPAIADAEARSKVDGKHRAVVCVVARTTPNPAPVIVLTRSEAGVTQPQVVQP